MGLEKLERETGVEPATSTLARSRSTTELLPLDDSFYTRWILAESAAAHAASMRHSRTGYDFGEMLPEGSGTGSHLAGPFHGLPVKLGHTDFGKLELCTEFRNS